VTFGPLNQGKTKEEAIEIAKETLAFIGLEGFEDRVTYKLSGGEKKLTALASILSMKPGNSTSGRTRYRIG
jgi:cobalt/nickel transport system ATP-binding protein